jgi:polysaccharide export outer membrane protein
MLVSCRAKRNLNYFTLDTRDSSHTLVARDFEPKIQPGDKLSIIVTALDPVAAQPYNIVGSVTSGGTQLSQGVLGYFIDRDGYLMFPQFGAIKAAGLTKTELRDTLIKRLETVLTNPLATIEYLNFRVTVLGEVGKQGVVNVPDGRINLLELLGQAGDITMYGRRNNIMVIREHNGKREFGKVNLLSNEIFKSPYFIMQQNDVVYVEMTDKKLNDTDQLVSRNISIITGVVSVLTTLGLLLLNIFN